MTDRPKPRQRAQETAAAPSLTIYIACYNRPDFAAQAIRSAVGQSDRSFRLVISDNSTNDSVGEMVAREFPELEYVRRLPSTTACIHGNIILAECTTTHVMIMHDDDMLAPAYVAEMMEFIRTRPDAACYACNAWTIDVSGRVLRKYFYLSLARYTEQTNPLWLLKRWFAYGTFAVAPLPAYIYDTRKIQGVQFDTETYGQMNDFVFIHQCIQRSRGLAWLNKPLYLYRLHSSQDSANISFDSWRKIRKYVLSNHRSHYHSPSFSASRALYLRKVLRRMDKARTARLVNRIAIKSLLQSPRDLCNRAVGLVADKVLQTRRAQKN